MGLVVFPVFRQQVPEAIPETSGEVLASTFPTLDRIANENGVPRLTSFADQREVPDDFEGSPEELDELLGPCDCWFPASEGRAAFSGLAQLLRSTPGLTSRLDQADDVLEELDDLVRVLEAAERVGTEFRLELG